MKLISKLITIVILISLIVLFTYNVYATDEDSLRIMSVKVTAPEDGIYGVGEEINITFTFSQPIRGVLPKYTIYFGKNTAEEIELNEVELKDFSTEAIYKYTIESGNNGELKPGSFVDSYNYEVETETGDKYMLSSPFMTNFQNKIYAATTIQWTDFEKAKLSIQSEERNRNDFDIKLENIQLNLNNNYYVHLSHNQNEHIDIKSIDDIYDSLNDDGEKIWGTTINTYSNEINMNSLYRNIFAEAGEVYATICEVDQENNIPRIVLENYKIERLQSLPLTQRITGYFFSDSTSTFCWEIYGDKERKVNYKVGIVSDVTLLKRIQNGEETAFEELMKYANENEPLSTGTLILGEDVTILDKINLDKNLYYYVYMEMDTENGKYLDIQDISLYKVIDNGNNSSLVSVSDESFEWDLEDGNNANVNNDSTIADFDKLPFAGKSIIVIFGIIILVVTSIILYKKYQLYKNIK